MKSTKKVIRYDYSKFKSKDGNYNHEILQNFEFWGFHPKHGKLHIDTKRYKIACKSVGIDDFLPKDLFEQRNTVYYEPSRRERYDYKINIFRDLINDLRNDWKNEYKPLLNQIKTPKKVEEECRLSGIAFTSCSDDYDEICNNAQLAGFKREDKYISIKQSLYCQFIQKICTEIDRYTLIVMTECGWKGKDFNFKQFLSFSDGLRKKQDKINFSQLPKYNAYNLMHKINNFLKHNSLESYQTLKKLYPENVISPNNESSNIKYENGMFAGDWIIIKQNYIDSLFNKLIEFFENYCKLYLNEDISRSTWDYDQYFYSAKKEMEYPEEYFGVIF